MVSSANVGHEKNRHKPHNVAAPPRQEQSPASKEENKNGLTEGAKTFCSTQQSNVITLFRDTKYDKSRNSPSLTSDDRASDCLLSLWFSRFWQKPGIV